MIGEATFGRTCSRTMRQVRHAERDRRLDEGLVLERAHLGIDEAREPRPVGDATARGSRSRSRVPASARWRSRARSAARRGRCPRRASAPRRSSCCVQPETKADRHADQQRGADGDDGDHQRDAGAEQDAAVDVGAHAVGAEQLGLRSAAAGACAGSCPRPPRDGWRARGARMAARTTSSTMISSPSSGRAVAQRACAGRRATPLMRRRPARIDQRVGDVDQQVDDA